MLTRREGKSRATQDSRSVCFRSYRGEITPHLFNLCSRVLGVNSRKSNKVLLVRSCQYLPSALAWCSDCLCRLHERPPLICKQYKRIWSILPTFHTLPTCLCNLLHLLKPWPLILSATARAPSQLQSGIGRTSQTLRLGCDRLNLPICFPVFQQPH